MNQASYRYLLAFLTVLFLGIVVTNQRTFLSLFSGHNGPNVASVYSVPNTVFDGKSTPLPAASCGESLVQDTGSGVGGGNSLKLTPDTWHTPVLKIYCGGRARQDFSGYATLSFMIRSFGASADPVNISFVTYAGPAGYAISPTISIAPYIQGGSISADWRLVTIPVSVLQSSAWNLSNVDSMNFSASPSSSVYYVDQIVFNPVSTPVTGTPTPTPTGTMSPSPVPPSQPVNPVPPIVPPVVPPIVPPPVTPVDPVPPPTGPSSSSVDLTKQFKIWSGKLASDSSISVTHGTIFTDTALGALVFKASPDQWNAGAINLSSLPLVYRKSLTSFDYVQMKVKVVPNAGTTLPAKPKGIFSIYAWPNTSAAVDLGNYIVGGSVLGSTYQIVRIPVSALRVAGGFDLTSMEYLWFSLPSGVAPTYSFEVTEIYALKLTPNDVTTIQTLSNTSIKITTKNRYPLGSVTSLSNYVLTSSNDPAYGTAGKSAVKVGQQNFVSGFEGSTGGSYGLGNAPVIESDIYLVFNPPLQDGKSYTLTVKNIPDMSGNNFAAPKLIPFAFMDASITGSVQANQVGYLPTSPKFAYIGNYLGDAGALGGVPNACRIVNASTGITAGTFTAVHRAADPKLSGDDVYSCDFSSIVTPGTYFVYVPGFGRTYNFTIAANIYSDVFRKLSDFYYNQRADVVIVNGQWSRPAGTLSTDKAVTLHPTDYISSANNPLPLSKTDYPVGTTFDMTGGWYDAGDYGKYILPASGPINDLLFAYELYPGKFRDGQADIPEKGNGVPDILDEVKYEIDWYQKMQAKDGGVFDRVTAQQWERDPYDIQPRYLDPESTHSTALYAAVLAQAYHVFKSSAAFESTYPGYADALLIKAKKAWTFLVAHPTPLPANGISVSGLGIGGGDYQDVATSNCNDGQTPGVNCPYSDSDNRAWAAAELYKSTGDSSYSDAFKKYWSQSPPFYGIQNNFVYHNPKASLAYVTTKNYPTDATIVAKIKSDYKVVADEEVGYTNNNTYRVGYRLDVPSYIGWGQFAHSASRAYDLIKASILLNDPSYLNAALTNFDVELGANPQYRSYITGVGSTPPKNPLHLTSIWLRQHAGATLPIPGITVFGPHYHASDGEDFSAAAQSDANIYPSLQKDAYPILRRYFDASGIVEQSEFGIGSVAPILSAFAYFTN